MSTATTVLVQVTISCDIPLCDSTFVYSTQTRRDAEFYAYQAARADGWHIGTTTDRCPTDA